MAVVVPQYLSFAQKHSDHVDPSLPLQQPAGHTATYPSPPKSLQLPGLQGCTPQAHLPLVLKNILFDKNIYVNIQYVFNSIFKFLSYMVDNQ